MATHNLSLTITGALSKRSLLLSGGDMAVQAGCLSNDVGTVEAIRELSIVGGSIANGGGATGPSHVAYSLADLRDQTTATSVPKPTINLALRTTAGR